MPLSSHPITTRVLFVAGSMRSGSTLIGRALGGLPGFVDVGEVHWFWEHCVNPVARCGCGMNLRGCVFWGQVVLDLERDNVDLEQVASDARTLLRTRSLGRVWLRRIAPGPSHKWSVLLRASELLFASIESRSHGAVIVDSSKLLPHFTLLREMTDVDLRVLHLVRDGRAVAHSWQKRQRSPFLTMLIWMIQNCLMELASRRLPYRSRVLYEVFADRPVKAVQRVLGELELTPHVLEGPLTDIALPPTHGIGGSSRARFSGETAEIALDDEWRTNLAPVTRAALTLIGMPLLKRYGYRLWH